MNFFGQTYVRRGSEKLVKGNRKGLMTICFNSICGIKLNVRQMKRTHKLD